MRIIEQFIREGAKDQVRVFRHRSQDQACLGSNERFHQTSTERREGANSLGPAWPALVPPIATTASLSIGSHGMSGVVREMAERLGEGFSHPPPPRRVFVETRRACRGGVLATKPSGAVRPWEKSEKKNIKMESCVLPFVTVDDGIDLEGILIGRERFRGPDGGRSYRKPR